MGKKSKKREQILIAGMIGNDQPDKISDSQPKKQNFTFPAGLSLQAKSKNEDEIVEEVASYTEVIISEITPTEEDIKKEAENKENVSQPEQPSEVDNSPKPDVIEINGVLLTQQEAPQYIINAIEDVNFARVVIKLNEQVQYILDAQVLNEQPEEKDVEKEKLDAFLPAERQVEEAIETVIGRVASFIEEEAVSRILRRVRDYKTVRTIVKNSDEMKIAIIHLAESTGLKIPMAEVKLEGGVVRHDVLMFDHRKSYTAKELIRALMYIGADYNRMKKTEELNKNLIKGSHEEIERLKNLISNMKEAGDLLGKQVGALNAELAVLGREPVYHLGDDEFFVLRNAKNQTKYVGMFDKFPQSRKLAEQDSTKVKLGRYTSVTKFAEAIQFVNYEIASETRKRLMKNRRISNVKNPHRYEVCRVVLRKSDQS